MTVKNEYGRKIYINVYGDQDDPQIDEAYYLDGDEAEVSQEDIDYILDTYGCEIDEQLMEAMVCAGEDYYSGDR